MKKKNVIWLFGDQHRSQALSYHGNPNVRTPNVDNLAATGMNFTQAVAGFPLCCPFRGSLLTSRYPHHCVPGHEYAMPEDQPTIAHVLNDHGYDTAYFGKWHVDGFHEWSGRGAKYIVPPHRRGGFKTWVGYENNNSPWDSWVHGGEGEEAFHYRLPGFETDELTNLLINYINTHAKDEKNKASPFFAVLSVQPPHDPYVAPEKWRARFSAADIKLRPNVPDIPRVTEQARRELAGYYAMIENWDWNVGRIQQALRDTGLAEDTHLIFFSDHGDMHGSHGQFRKTTAYEEAIRIPFIISGETSFYDGRKTGLSDAPVNHVDIAPTTLGLCGVDAPDWMEGFDYSGLRLDSRPLGELPDSAYIQNVIPTKHGDSVDKAWRGIVTQDGWKYVCFNDMDWLMFNLNEDPYEFVNLAHNPSFGRKRRELIQRLRQWVEKTGDQFIVPADR